VEDVLIILAVEDDQLVQVMVEEALSDGGFETSMIASDEEAIALLQSNKPKYRALVTDIDLLGKMDGWEVARVARELNPVLPVIYMTGTNGEEWPSRGVPNSVLLTKPFAPAQIVTAVAALLNANPPEAVDKPT
jgi:DNA-binding response OmpR family regulator